LAGTVEVFTGVEAGDLGEFAATSGTVSTSTGTVHAGGYALRCNPTGSGTGYTYYTATSGSGAVRFYFRMASAPSSRESFAEVFTGGDASLQKWYIDPDGKIYTAASGGTGGNTTLSAGAWYRIVLYFNQISCKTVVNGAEETNLSFNPGSASAALRVRLGKTVNTNSASVDFFYDDIAWYSNANTSGELEALDGQCIARQGKSGTPTYGAWTKTSSQTIDQVWNATPFSATNNAAATAANQAQTMLVESFSGTQSGHGTETLSASDTINKAKAAIVGKRGTGGGQTHKVRFRYASADNDSADWTDIATSDKYFQFVSTPSSLTDLNGSEVGGVQGAGGSQLFTIEDAWAMVDYTPAAVADFVPVDPFGMAGVFGI
jgi:hypothetical protein